MNLVRADIGIAICGFLTSLLVAFANVGISNATGFNLFTFSVWFIIPVGAIGVGIAAASGYYFGALYFHRRPNFLLLIQMIIVAIFTQCLIYYLEYATLEIDGQKLSDYISLWKYLDISFTKSHYSMSRFGDLGEPGLLGYLLAIAHFIGFIAGGFILYGILSRRLVCEKCQMYFRRLATKTKTFEGYLAFKSYYDSLFKHRPDSIEFAKLIKGNSATNRYSTTGVIVKAQLCECPNCKSQIIIENGQEFDGRNWVEVDSYHRKVLIPDGIDLRSAFSW